jgi:MFS family permease
MTTDTAGEATTTIATPVRDGLYGWVLVAITFLAMALVLGSRFSMGMFLPYMPPALDSSVAEISGAMAIAMIGAAITQPLAGFMLDRWGGSVVLTIGLTCAGLALCGTAFATSLWQVIVFMGLGSSIAYSTVSPVSTTSIVATWFDKRRGAALGVATSGTKMAMVILPPLIAALIGLFDWRVAMMCLGVMVWVLIPVVIAFVRPAPGSEAAIKAAARLEARRTREPPSVRPEPAQQPEGKTIREALALPAFWFIAFALFANGMIMNLVFIHLPNYVLSEGHGEHLAAMGLSFLGAVGVFGTMFTGALSDRIGRRNVMLVMFGVRGITALLIVVAPGPVSMATFVIVFGLLGYGAIGVIGAMGPELFGRRNIGSIMSVAYVFNQLGGAAGVYAGGASLDYTGNYSASLWLSIIFTLLSFACIMLIRGGERQQ